MPDNKLIIRRLPPSLSEDDFLKQISPLSEHDYFCYFEANSGLGPHYSFCRAYINFLNAEDMAIFRERFDNYIFLDKNGHEYPAVVEQSFWNESPKNGPFFTSKQTADKVVPSTSSTQAATTVPLSQECNDLKLSSPTPPTEAGSTTIEQDPDFIQFFCEIQDQKKGSQQTPMQTLESNLDELTKTSTNATSVGGKKDETKVVTPLVGYVNQKRILSRSSRSKPRYTSSSPEMPGLRPLCAMGFIGSVGLTCQALACTGENGNFWPLLVFLFYLILPIPTTITRRIIKETIIGMDDSSSKRARDYSLFVTAGIVVSSFALPLVLARTPIDSPIIAPAACFFTELGNFLCYVTVALFCMYFKPLSGF